MACEIVSKSNNDPKKVKEIVLERGLLDKNKLDEILNYNHSITYL